MSPVGSSSCPYCDQAVYHEGPPLPFGLATCSHCGQQVWFLTVGGALSYFRYEAAGLVRHLFHGLPDEQRLPPELKFDSFDRLELLMDFEEALEEAS